MQRQLLRLLEAIFRHLALREDTIPSNGFNSFRIERRVLVVWLLVLEADIALFSHKNRRQIDLPRRIS
jgi:hypothetical protein